VAVVSRRPLLRALLAGLCLAVTPGPLAAQKGPSEYEVKAAFLYNFARFVEWPPDAPGRDERPFVVAVLGDDPFGDALDRTLAGKTVASRPIAVRRLSSPEEAQHANIVFVSSSEKAQISHVLRVLGGARVLTVGEMSGFAEQGGMIGFRTENRRIRFDINADQAHRAGLRISSQLLKLARIVPSR
jgi:hypothetical protein